jgi:ribonuclease Z
MDIVLLGTGSPLPDAERAGPATFVRAGASSFLVDCGRGVLLRAAAAGAGVQQLTALLLTHLHSDHITDLGDVITTRWVTTFAPAPLPVIGPARTATVVEHVLASLEPDIEYRLAHHVDLTWRPDVPVTEVSDGEAFATPDVRVLAAPSDHRPVAPTVAYRIEHGGHSVVLAGDTVPCAGLDRLCEAADVLVHTVVRDDLLRNVPLQRLRDVCDYHSSVAQAAQTAARGEVGALVLTHLVPAPPAGGDDEWRALAAEHFDGAVHVGRDLLTVTL